MNRRIFLPFLVVLAVMASACSDDSAPSSVASLETTPTTTSPVESEPDPLADSEAAMLAFTQCLRGQGIDIDDPTVDANGNLQLAPIAFEATVDDPSEIPDPSKFEALLAPCEEHLEGIVMNASPVDTTEMEDSLLAYAGCMRDNGVDMPDPDFSSGMIDLGDVGEAEFEAADAACKHHLASLGLSEVEAP